MNRRFSAKLLVFLFLLLSSVYFPGYGVNAADHKLSTAQTIQVVMDDNYPPYAFLDSNGTIIGILADQWALWQKETGVRVNIRAMDWKDALNGMKAGAFDVIDTIFMTEERAGWLDFSAPYAQLEVCAFFNNEISGITEVKSLKDFIVAVKEGDAAIDFLHRYGIDNLIFYKSYESIIQAAHEHKINVFVIDKPPALYLLHKYGMQNQYNVTQPFHSGKFHWAVKRGNTALFKQIEAGFDRISPEEFRRIETKWHGTPLLRSASVRYLRLGIGVASLLILALGFWNRTLRKAVKKHTFELEMSKNGLRESETQYRELVENANSIILRRDRDGRISFFNEFAQRFFGYAASEIIGKNIIGTIVPDTDQAGHNLRRMIDNIVLQPNRYAVDVNENMCRDGRRVWIYWTNKPLYDAANEVSELLCVGNDITDQKKAEEALRRERQRLEFVIAGSRLGTWEWNVQSNATIRNETWAQQLGYAFEELKPYNYATWERLVHPDDLVPAQRAMANYFDGTTPDYDCEFRMQHKDGHWIWILDRGRILTRDHQGNPLLMFGTHTDITKIKHAEEKLQTTNDLLSLFIKHSPIYAFVKEVTATESRVLHASDNYQDMVGIAGCAMVGKTMKELFPPDLAEKITISDWQVVSQGQTLRLAEDLNDRHYTSIKFPIRLGEKHLLAGYTIDITERKQMEEELRKRENQLQKILEILPIGLWFADKDGNLLRSNPMGVKIWSAEPKVPMSEYGIFKAWRLPSREPVKAEDWALVQTIRDGVTIVDELLEIEAFDGKRKTILNYSTPVFNDHGDVDGAIVVMVDISDRIVLESQLNQAQKMESIGRLAGGVAHDFNNMLSVILGHTELALNTIDSRLPLFGSLQNIRKAARRSADLTQQLLAFARKQTVAPKVLDLNETVTGMLKMLQPLIGENIDLAWLPDKAPEPVNMDPSQIDQILVNLCVNARDAIKGPGKITIETGTAVFDADYCAKNTDVDAGDYVLLAVSDNGCGMDQQTIANLFEPFFTTKKTGKGTGLGLATVYGIVKQNNGFINVYSEPGQGTTLKIYLPLYTTKAEQTVRTEVPEPPTRGHETILLVEDEPMILEVTMAMLKPLGYTVLSAATPGDAMGLAREHAGEIHLLMTDVVMPEMNGRDLARNLLSLHPGIKRLFMSGYTANVIAHHGVLDEGVHFIQKPFSMHDLSAKIREVLYEDSDAINI